MIDINNIDWNAFALGKSGRAVKLLYNKEPLQVCTSSLFTPFGVKSSEREWSNFTEYYVDCSLNNASKENSVTFKEFIGRLDEKINELVRENISLFTTPKTVGDIDTFTYTPILKENGSYPKLMKLQFQRDKNGNFESFMFDEDRNKISVNDNNISKNVARGKVFKCIIECSKVWLYNGRVGSIWNIVQLKFSQNTYIPDQTQAQESRVNYNTLMIDD
jgi:hypothetical protein